MALETGTYISDLVTTNPPNTDGVSQADDHLRLIKSTVKATFPNITGAVTATHTELNYVDGVTSAIQTQLDAKASKASANTFTAAQTINGANLLLNSNSDYEPQTQLTHAGATAGSASYSILNRARGTYGSPTIVSSGDQLGNVLFQGYDGTAYRSAASIEAQVDGTPGANDMPGRLTFKTTPDGSTAATERMRITSAGDVGIGTSSPSFKLDVNGNSPSVATVARVYNGDASATAYAGLQTGTGSGLALQMYAYNGIGHVGTTSSNPLVFLSNNTERMRIDAAGAVTIGGNPVIAASGTAAQGDVLYHNGTAWTRLAAGTSGQVLKTNGAGANPSWVTPTVGGMTLLGTITTTSGGSQSLTGQTLTSYKFLKFVFNAVSTTSTGNMSIGAGLITGVGAAASVWYGTADLELATGIQTVTLGIGFGATELPRVSNSGYSTATTTITVSVASGTFDAGTITIYGIA